MSELENIASQIEALNLPPRERKEFLRELIAKTWPNLPPYSNLEHPYIAEVQQASVACGVLPVFKENGIWKVVVMKAGTHYQREGHYDANPEIPTYMLPGGFIDLKRVPGSSFVKADDDRGENAREGAAREIEEELVDDTGKPVLPMDPARLKPQDSKTVSLPNGERHSVNGMMVELTPEEVQKIKAHVSRLENEKEYRHAVRAHTENSETGKPESCVASILSLQDIVQGKHTLLYPDQQSLFEIVHRSCAGESVRR